jgi:site-specific DNA recombinase
VQVRTCTAGELDLSTPSGRMTARVVGAVARHESEHKAERQRRKALQLAEQGRSNGGPRTFGYEPDHQRVREAEAVLVREAAARALAGESLTSIAADWNRRGIPTVRGADGWTYQALRRVITSPRHAGLRAHRGEVVGDAVWPAIIDRDTYDQLRIRLRPGQPPASRVRKRLLTGLAVCGRCGERLYSKTGSGRAQGTPVYRCVKVPGRGQLTACGALSVVADPLDQVVAAQVLHVLSGPALAAALTADVADERQTLADQLAGDEARLADLAGDYADGTIERAEWRAARDRVAGRLEQTRRRLAAQQDRGVLAHLPTSTADLTGWWDTAAVTARRSVVDALIDQVVVAPKGHRGGKRFDPDRATITWRS